MNIEQAQALEMICYYAKEHLKDNKTMSQSVDIAKDIIKKELKALEIIKEKPQATLWLIQHCDKEMEYEDMLFLFKEDITKEQFDLLKGVLL